MDKPQIEDERITFADEPDERDSDLDSKLTKESPADKARPGEIVLRSVWPARDLFRSPRPHRHRDGDLAGSAVLTGQRPTDAICRPWRL
jgi:hypothetical protein